MRRRVLSTMLLVVSCANTSREKLTASAPEVEDLPGGLWECNIHVSSVIDVAAGVPRRWTEPPLQAAFRRDRRPRSRDRKWNAGSWSARVPRGRSAMPSFGRGCEGAPSTNA
jgi:hypothetical protein